MQEINFNDLDQVRMAFAIDVKDEHVRDFAVMRLWSTLKDFRCGVFESDPIIKWYWKVAPTWPEQSSQLEFDRYARARISDKIGYSRNRSESWSTVYQLFDIAKHSTVTLKEVLEAITFLTPTWDFPHDVFENGDHAIIDLTKRSDSPKLLKVDASFLETIKMLYPWERHDDTIVKKIPIGSTIRELNLLTLAYWVKNPTADVNRITGFQFVNQDRLDWTGDNVSAFGGNGWGSNERFFPTPTERIARDGSIILTTVPGAVVTSDALDKTATLDGVDAQSSKTAGFLNKFKEPEDVGRLRRDIAGLKATA